MTLALIDGTNVVMRMVSVMQERFEPDRIILSAERKIREFTKLVGAKFCVVAFDGANGWRYDVHPEYKSKRTVDTRIWQARAIMQLTAAGWKCEVVERFEADDVIGALSARSASSGRPCCVLSGDSDLLQLVWPPDVRVWQFGLKQKDEPYFVERTDQYVMERYGLRWPAQLAEFKALTGEGGESIDGVYKIGEKGARKLLASFDSIDDMHQGGALTPTQYEAAMFAYRLVKLDGTAPVPPIHPRECAIPEDKA